MEQVTDAAKTGIDYLVLNGDGIGQIVFALIRDYIDISLHHVPFFEAHGREGIADLLTGSGKRIRYEFQSDVIGIKVSLRQAVAGAGHEKAARVNVPRAQRKFDLGRRNFQGSLLVIKFSA